MDTTTYASVAMLPSRIARDHKHSVRQDQELLPLDLSMIQTIVGGHISLMKLGERDQSIPHWKGFWTDLDSEVPGVRDALVCRS